jgi:hypothetical protein
MQLAGVPQALPEAVLWGLCLFLYDVWMTVVFVFLILEICSGGMDAACYDECGTKDFRYTYFICIIFYCSRLFQNP